MAQRERPPRKIVDGRTVVVLEEKHGSRHYVVETDEELFELCLNVLRGRLKSGYFYHEPDPKYAPKLPDFKKEDIEGMPASLRDPAMRQWQRYLSDKRGWDRSVEEWSEINRAASEADGALAWEVLRGRSDHEYEKISLEPAADLRYNY